MLITPDLEIRVRGGIAEHGTQPRLRGTLLSWYSHCAPGGSTMSTIAPFGLDYSVARAIERTQRAARQKHDDHPW